jgi:hypothetical protein
MSKMYFLPFRPAFDSAGITVPGSQHWFTLAGTNTPSAPFADTTLATPLENPVISNGIGYLPPVYLNPAISYRVRIYGPDAEVGVDTPLEEYDPYVPALANTDILSDLGASTGADLVEWIASSAGARPRSVTDKLRDIQSIFDFTGAVGNGTNDDSVGLQSALDEGGLIILPSPPVRYNFETPVTVSVDGTQILCLGNPELYIDTGASHFSTVSASHFTFSGARLTGDPTLSAAAFLIDTAAAALVQIRISDIAGSNLYHFYEDNGGNALFGAYLERIKLDQHRGYGINTTKHFGYFYPEKFGVSRVGLSGAAYNYPAIKVQNAEGVFLDECAHDGTNATSIQTGQHGFEFDNCTFVSIENTVPDHVGGNGILAVNCGTIQIDGIDIPNINLSAIKATGCDKVRIDGGVFGSFSTGNAAACGVELTNCTSVEIPSADASSMKSDGFKITGCGDVSLGLTMARANGGLGYNITTCTSVTATAAQAISNTGIGFGTVGCNTVITSGLISRSNTGRGISSGTGDIAVHHVAPRMSANTAGNYIIADTTNRISLGVLSDNSLVNITAPGSG